MQLKRAIGTLKKENARETDRERERERGDGKESSINEMVRKILIEALLFEQTPDTYTNCVRTIWEGDNKPKVFKMSLSLTTFWNINHNRVKYGSKDPVRKLFTIIKTENNGGILAIY